MRPLFHVFTVFFLSFFFILILSQTPWRETPQGQTLPLGNKGTPRSESPPSSPAGSSGRRKISVSSPCLSGREGRARPQAEPPIKASPRDFCPLPVEPDCRPLPSPRRSPTLAVLLAPAPAPSHHRSRLSSEGHRPGLPPRPPPPPPAAAGGCPGVLRLRGRALS